MKFLFLSLLALAPAFAAEPSLEEAVANHIQALAWDTVNEGSQNAQVIYDGGKPSVSCKLSNVKGSAGKKWAFCRVDFKVTFDDLEDAAERQCKLLFSYEPAKGVRSLEREEDSIADCLETLSEGP
jgi:hypothetical protein